MLFSPTVASGARGDNQWGQLGIGCHYSGSISNPTEIGGVSDAIDMAASGNYTCALRSDGTVHCWGNNIPMFSCTPEAVTGISSAIGVAVGSGHACALLSNGEVSCWGDNQYGELGDGSTDDSSTPVPVSSLSGVVDIAAGMSHTCAVLASGGVRCWGYNYSGQLGNGTNEGTNEPNPLPLVVSGIANATEVSAGTWHTCVRLADGTLRCWGGAGWGQLGDGENTSSYVPVPVLGIDQATSIGAGDYHTCATTEGASFPWEFMLECWGRNSAGQLGDATTTSSSTPVGVMSSFGQIRWTLRIDPGGSGSGRVSSDLPGIDCPSDCSEEYDFTRVVTLTPEPDPGSSFVGWGGDSDCSDGVVEMDAHTYCTVTFEAAVQDSDDDNIPDDGDGSGTAGDAPCTGGATESCDDNCPTTANSDQADQDGDGIGSACECGDASGDGRVDTIDARLIQRCAVGDITDPAICTGLCDVTGEGTCDTIDARLIQRLVVGDLSKADLTCAQRP